MKHGDLDIRELRTAAEFEACVALQQRVWGANFTELVPVIMLRLAQRLGGIAAGAFAGDGSMVGFVFGISGCRAQTRVHWSDMLAVRADAQDRGLGEALKRYQRSVLLGRGVETVYWTFDPLEARNAHLNFVRLGALAREYVRNLYGETDSPLHTGLGTDRLVVEWELASDRVERRLSGERDQSDQESATINAVEIADELPRCVEPALGLTAPLLRLRIPSEIQRLKAADPELAREWRQQTRAALEHYFSAGYTVTDFERGQPTGSYVLARTPLRS